MFGKLKATTICIVLSLSLGIARGAFADAERIEFEGLAIPNALARVPIRVIGATESFRVSGRIYANSTVLQVRLYVYNLQSGVGESLPSPISRGEYIDDALATCFRCELLQNAYFSHTFNDLPPGYYGIDAQARTEAGTLVRAGLQIARLGQRAGQQIATGSGTRSLPFDWGWRCEIYDQSPTFGIGGVGSTSLSLGGSYAACHEDRAARDEGLIAQHQAWAAPPTSYVNSIHAGTYMTEDSVGIYYIAPSSGTLRVSAEVEAQGQTYCIGRYSQYSCGTSPVLEVDVTAGGRFLSVTFPTVASVAIIRSISYTFTPTP